MSKQPERPKNGEGRRGFLRMASVGAVATGVAAVAAPAKSEAVEVVREDGTLGYRETDHVKKAYELARF